MRLDRASFQPRALLQCELQHLRDHRYAVVPNWIPAVQTDRLQQDTIAVDLFGCTHASHIGNAAFSAAIYDPSVRRSRQCTLYPPPSNAAGSVRTRSQLISAVDGLRRELQSSSTIALPYLMPFETELSYLLYPVGGHYGRHFDNRRSDDGWRLQGRQSSDGGSFCGGRTRPVISFIPELNTLQHDYKYILTPLGQSASGQ